MLYFRKSDSSILDNTPPPAKQARVEEPSSGGEANTLEKNAVTIISQDTPLPPSSLASRQYAIPQPEEIEDIPEVTVALAPEYTFAKTVDKGKAIAQDI